MAKTEKVGEDGVTYESVGQRDGGDVARYGETIAEDADSAGLDAVSSNFADGLSFGEGDLGLD